MTIKKKYLRVVHALFIVLLLIQLLPDQLSGDTYAQYVIWFAVGVEVLTLLVSSFINALSSDQPRHILLLIVLRFIPVISAHSVTVWVSPSTVK